ncbi:MAG: hypothetical protein ACLFR1_00650 [Spirochaetia bacterium]
MRDLTSLTLLETNGQAIITQANRPIITMADPIYIENQVFVFPYDDVKLYVGKKRLFASGWKLEPMEETAPGWLYISKKREQYFFSRDEKLQNPQMFSAGKKQYYFQENTQKLYSSDRFSQIEKKDPGLFPFYLIGQKNDAVFSVKTGNKFDLYVRGKLINYQDLSIGYDEDAMLLRVTGLNGTYKIPQEWAVPGTVHIVEPK